MMMRLLWKQGNNHRDEGCTSVFWGAANSSQSIRVLDSFSQLSQHNPKLSNPNLQPVLCSKHHPEWEVGGFWIDTKLFDYPCVVECTLLRLKYLDSSSINRRGVLGWQNTTIGLAYGPNVPGSIPMIYQGTMCTHNSCLTAKMMKVLRLSALAVLAQACIYQLYNPEVQAPNKELE